VRNLRRFLALGGAAAVASTEPIPLD
jgi:hypothetical protein